MKTIIFKVREGEVVERTEKHYTVDEQEIVARHGQFTCIEVQDADRPHRTWYIDKVIGDDKYILNFCEKYRGCFDNVIEPWEKIKTTFKQPQTAVFTINPYKLVIEVDEHGRRVKPLNKHETCEDILGIIKNSKTFEEIAERINRDEALGVIAYRGGSHVALHGYNTKTGKPTEPRLAIITHV